MKRKWLIPALLLLVLGIVWYLAGSSLGISNGRCIVVQNGTCLILLGDDPIVLYNRSGREDLFEDLETGDEIQILHDGILETYPGKTSVYFCRRVREGDILDIPERTIESLSSLGWTIVDDSGLQRQILRGSVLSCTQVVKDPENQLLKLDPGTGEELTITLVSSSALRTVDGVSAGDSVRVKCIAEDSGYLEAEALTEFREIHYEQSGISMGLLLPAGWEYEFLPDAEDGYSFGICFWPEAAPEGQMYLGYYPQMFGVCGTGLTQEEIRLDNGLEATIGTYDGRAQWDFISIHLPEDPLGFAVRAESVDDWPEEYHQEAMEMIHTLRLDGR